MIEIAAIILILVIIILLVPKLKESCGRKWTDPVITNNQSDECIMGGGKVVRKDCYFRAGEVQDFPYFCSAIPFPNASQKTNVNTCQCSEKMSWDPRSKKCIPNLF